MLLAFETPLSFALVAQFSLPLIFLSLPLIYCLLTRLPALTFNPNQDIYELAQLSFFWAYWYAEISNKINCSHSPFKTAGAALAASPDILVVQSESFFDIRELSRGIKPEVLSNYDQICVQATYHGKLDVPAWGADTVRTECGFLSGLSPEELGIHRFNPYRKLATSAIPNLVRELKSQGYRTICLHPFAKEFYRRNKVFPLMGFDEFIDIKQFSGQKEGQYTGDMELAKKISNYLSASTQESKRGQPLFIFTITMENHGPLHLEKPDAADYGKFYTPPVAKEYDDLLIYLKHLQNADLMIKHLYWQLQDPQLSNPDGVLFCWYGDHVPIMPSVYKNLSVPDGQTDYFMYCNPRLKGALDAEKLSPCNNVNLGVNQLAPLIINLLQNV